MNTDNFFDTTQREDTVKFSRIDFLRFDFGQHLVRILGKPLAVETHFLRKTNSTIKCLGNDCPICSVNRKIMAEYPKDFLRQPGFITRSKRHYCNVLDRTPTKICTECSEEIKRGITGLYPPVCSNGHPIAHLTEVPLNKVKVANISDTNATIINDLNKSILDREGNKVGINNFDITFIATKAGDKKAVTPIPVPTNNDPVEVPVESLFDLTRAVIELTSEEILDLLRGVSIRDIFLARRASPVNEALAQETLAQETVKVSEDIQKRIAELYA